MAKECQTPKPSTHGAVKTSIVSSELILAHSIAEAGDRPKHQVRQTSGIMCSYNLQAHRILAISWTTATLDNRMW